MATPPDRSDAPPLEHTRQVTIEALCEHFAGDRLTVEEFERRVDSANQARTQGDLASLLDDLPRRGIPIAPRGAGETGRPEGVTLMDPSEVKDREMVLAIMGGTGRKGRWHAARQNLVVAIMGGAELDFREAVLSAGVTEVQVYALWGGVDIVVPPNVHVESQGFAVLGGFEHAAEDSETPGPGTPTIRITGAAVMGAVDISVRFPGESARDARRRRRLERRERKRLEGGGH